ncbi:MAG: co-chaperone DjlA [Gammaproteobacteria bacterium]|nr:MAG: co-chaperone DjlA [Gammaproteobacteria bacterium]
MWGKILGVGFGMMLGGPFGAFLGLLLGHNFDKGIGQSSLGFSNSEAVQSKFFESVFSVMGHIAKADGKVTEQEIQMARVIMTQMQLNEARKTEAVKFFNLGKQPEFDLDATLRAFKQTCHGHRNLMQMFLEIQIAAGFADGGLQNSEKQILENISRVLGFNQIHLKMLIDSFLAQQRFHQSGQQAYDQKDHLADAYTVLGIEENTSDKDTKKAYRKLMSQHHPDKLVAKGLPADMMAVATEKSQKIQAAWELIRKQRGIR